MKKQDLQRIIKEELNKVLTEDVNSTVEKEVQKIFTKMKMPVLRIDANVKSAFSPANVEVKFRDMYVDEPYELMNLYNDDYAEKIIFSDVEQLKTDTYRFYIDEKEGMFAQMEAKIDIPDQGYGADYYNIKSDIMEQWDDLAIITKDIKGFLEAAHEAGGPKLVKQAMNAILAGVKDSQKLLRLMRGSSKPEDVDLA